MMMQPPMSERLGRGRFELRAEPQQSVSRSSSTGEPARPTVTSPLAVCEPGRVLVCELSEAGIVTRVNRSLVEVSGIPVEEWIGSRYFDWWHPDMPPAARVSLMQSLNIGTTWYGLVKLVRRQGGSCWHEVYMAPAGKEASGHVVVHNPPDPEMLVVADILVSRCADVRRSGRGDAKDLEP